MSAPDVVVRDATDEDLAELVGLLEEMGSAVAEYPDPARDRWRAMREHPGRGVLVAVERRELVGTIDLTIVPNLTHDGRPWAIIENLVVASGARGRGIGGALLEEATRRARAADCYKIQLLSNEKREDAHRLYRRLGFDAPVRGFRRYFEADDD